MIRIIKVQTADFAVASIAGYNITKREKQSMITIIYLFPYSSIGKGPIVSIFALSQILYVDETNLFAKIEDLRKTFFDSKDKV